MFARSDTGEAEVRPFFLCSNVGNDSSDGFVSGCVVRPTRNYAGCWRKIALTLTERQSKREMAWLQQLYVPCEELSTAKYITAGPRNCSTTHREKRQGSEQ
jgi:hypothetical protein